MNRKIVPVESARPLLITGCWRSGTTLASRIMNVNADLEVFYDLVHFLRFFPPHRQRLMPDDIERIVDSVSSRLEQRFSISLPLMFEKADFETNISHASLYDSIMRSLMQDRGKEWGEKTNLAWSSIPDFLENFPNGRVLHLIRDPRAVLLSWKRFTNAPGQDYLDSVFNAHNSMSSARDYSRYYSSTNYLAVTYEDLVDNPEAVVRRICDCFGLEYQDAMIDGKNFIDRTGNTWEANTIHQVAFADVKTITGAFKDKWKTDLMPLEVGFVDAVCKEFYCDFGYELADLSLQDSDWREVFHKVSTSGLVSNGLGRFLMHGSSVERFPSDPCNPTNWAKN